jgi:predicted amidophosphoribosyltransferase
MTRNPFGVQFTKCPRCESERASLASRYCSRCGKRLVSERGLKIGWWIFESLRLILALAFFALASRLLYSCLSS